MVGIMFSSTELRHAMHYTFVLWGEHFDETAAVLFVSALRQEGIRVKIVGLAGQSATGMHNLALGADLTLGEALDLPAHANCLIVPCSGGAMRRFENDPRLFQFLSQICLPHTRIIMKEVNTLEATTLAHLALLPDNFAIYDACADLLGFAHHLAQSMAAELWAA